MRSYWVRWSPEYDYQLALKRLLDENVLDAETATSFKDKGDAAGKKALTDWLRRPVPIGGRHASVPPSYDRKRPARSHQGPIPAWTDNPLRKKSEQEASKPCADACVLWAPEDPEALLGVVIDAFVLGCSLQRHGTTHDRVLLATEDVIRSPLVDALRLFWEVHVRVGKHITTPGIN
jgi:hypothetical protein